jgi:sterol 3beta-glucosyltransferase
MTPFLQDADPGLMPGMETLMSGEIQKKRTMLAEMIHGCWEACYSPCPDTGRTFMADAIISNPPAFSHIHCAEALGIPLHMTFSEYYATDSQDRC